MKKSVGTGALLVLVAGAQGAFRLNSVDLGGDTASFGLPITTSTSYYQDAFGNNYPPSAAFIGIFPTLGDDSYIAMDSGGPSTSGRTANGPGGSTPGFGATVGHFSGNNMLTGGYFTGGGVQSAPDPFGGNGVMIAQLTTTGTLTGNRIRVATIGDIVGTHPLVLNSLTPVNGLYCLSTSRQSASGTVYNIWVTDAPAPGAAALLGLAGIGALRRRR